MDVHVNCFDRISNVLARYVVWGWRPFVFTQKARLSSCHFPNFKY